MPDLENAVPLSRAVLAAKVELGRYVLGLIRDGVEYAVNAELWKEKRDSGKPSMITDAQCIAAMREFSAQKGESHDAMWSQYDEAERHALIGEWRAILECAQLTSSSALSRSPVPEQTPE